MGPLYTSKTDKKEFERFKREDAKANRIANFIVVSILVAIFAIFYLTMQRI
jgi:hypothetical protein